jgi:hypothetical protein
MSARTLTLIRFLAVYFAATGTRRGSLVTATLLWYLRRKRHSAAVRASVERLARSVMLHDAIAEHVRRRMALPQRRISAEERARDARRAARNLRRPSRERLPWMFKGLGDGTPYVDNLTYMRLDMFQTFFGCVFLLLLQLFLFYMWALLRGAAVAAWRCSLCLAFTVLRRRCSLYGQLHETGNRRARRRVQATRSLRCC